MFSTLSGMNFRVGRASAQALAETFPYSLPFPGGRLALHAQE